MVAALHAKVLFDRPMPQTLQVLEAAAKQAQERPAVRAAALHYLVTGELLGREERSINGTAIPGLTPACRGRSGVTHSSFRS